MTIGLSMREANASTYVEERDAIARDWYRLLDELVGDDWVLLPNLGSDTRAYAAAQGVTAIVLSGGNDLGSAPTRDASEVSLCEWAEVEGIPLLGVCRGAQLLFQRAGGRLEELPTGHVAQDHGLKWVARPRVVHAERELPSRVNSFHGWGIASTQAAARADVRVLATAEDGSVEAFECNAGPMTGILWHPERGAQLRDAEVALCRATLALGGRR